MNRIFSFIYALIQYYSGLFGTCSISDLYHLNRYGEYWFRQMILFEGTEC